MITVSAKALWWREPEVCTCPPEEWYEPVELPCPHDTRGGWPRDVMFTEIDGWQYLTDRYVFLPAIRLTELPVGYDQVLRLQPMPRQASEGSAEWMTASVLPASSYRQFHPQRLDPLEQAGFKIRGLVGVKDVHGICDGIEVVGLISPIVRSREQDHVGRVAR